MNSIVLVAVAVVCCTSIGSAANLPNYQTDVESRLIRLEERAQRAEELMTQTRNFLAELVTRLAKPEDYEQPHIITKRQAVDEPIIEEAVDDMLQSVINAHGVLNVQIGQAGAPGAPGPSGETGVPGLNGSPGSPGSPGPIGLPGPAGEDGRNGTDGFDGSPGPVGPKGDQDPIGPAGEDGSSGQPGIQGSIGPIGPRGADGRDGLPGAAGSSSSCNTPIGCPSPYNIVEEKCVYISRAKASWMAAKQYCENQNAYLITFSSKDTSLRFGQYLYSQVSTNGNWWIGAKKVSGVYYWMGITTEQVPANGSSGSQWYHYHAGDDCLEYEVDSSSFKGWHASYGTTCDTAKYFICEKLF